MKNHILFLLMFLQAALADEIYPPRILTTDWGAKLQKSAVWSEYPRPLLKRDGWLNLNGLWSYAITEKASSNPKMWDGEILVPFCLESTLSGVNQLLKPEQSLWYQRSFSAAPENAKRTLLHFEAVDYEASIWVNGQEIGKHVGGYTPFEFDITAALVPGENKLEVRVFDATEGYQIHGKQSLDPRNIWCKRVSGIWQSVWIEQVPMRSIRRLEFNPNISEGTLEVKAVLAGDEFKGEHIRVTASIDGHEAGRTEGKADGVSVVIRDPQVWTPETPNLYDLNIELVGGDGELLDTVKSYSALRTVSKVRDPAGDLRIALNGKPVFLLGTLDQGMWPEGLLTPPSDEAMVSDIKFLKASGFNMVRKHVKVENDRYYYHCDRLGLVVWQDQVNAGMWEGDQPAGASPPWIRLAPNPKDANWPEDAKRQWIAEYKAMVDMLRNHPSIIVWSLFNESWGQHDSLDLAKMAKEYDPTRLLCVASGGNFWPAGDIASNHNYPDPSFPLRDPRFRNYVKMIGEMGGYGWAVTGHVEAPEKTISYGSMPRSLEEWKIRYAQSVGKLAGLRRGGVAGAVYTETADTWNEVNGLLTYDRLPKVEASWLRQVNENVYREDVQPMRR